MPPARFRAKRPTVIVTLVLFLLGAGVIAHYVRGIREMRAGERELYNIRGAQNKITTGTRFTRSQNKNRNVLPISTESRPKADELFVRLHHARRLRVGKKKEKADDPIDSSARAVRSRHLGANALNKCNHSQKAKKCEHNRTRRLQSGSIWFRDATPVLSWFAHRCVSISEEA